MTCETCGSHDVIAIQGTNYCLNCGNIVLGKSEKKVAAKKTVQPGEPTKTSVMAQKTSAEPEKLKPTAKPQPKRSQPKGFNAHPQRFSLTVSGVLALIAAAATVGVLQLKVDSDGVLYTGAALLIVVIVTLVLAQGALMYGLSRAEDRRPTEHARWWAVARSGFMDAVNVNVLILIKTIVMLIAVAAFSKALPTLKDQPQPVYIAAVAAANLFFVWSFLALYTMRRIAVVAVMIGNLSAYHALWLAFKLYMRNGGHLLATTLETLLGRLLVVLALIGAGYAALTYVPSPTVLQTEIGTAAAAALAVFLLVLVSLEWETRLWLHQYRHLATSFKPAERVRLLTGRIRTQS